MSDKIEFHIAGEGHLLSVRSAHAPDRGDLVVIDGKTYRTVGRTYRVDQSDEPACTDVVCVVALEAMVF